MSTGTVAKSRPEARRAGRREAVLVSGEWLVCPALGKLLNDVKHCGCRSERERIFASNKH